MAGELELPAWQHDGFLPARDFVIVGQDRQWREALQVIDGPRRFRDAAADRGRRPLPPPATALRARAEETGPGRSPGGP